MNLIELNDVVSKVNTIQNEHLKNYLALKDTKDVSLERIITNFNHNEVLIYQAIEILRKVSL